MIERTFPVVLLIAFAAPVPPVQARAMYKMPSRVRNGPVLQPLGERPPMPAGNDDRKLRVETE